jgi:hypothetical protein
MALQKDLSHLRNPKEKLEAELIAWTSPAPG